MEEGGTGLLCKLRPHFETWLSLFKLGHSFDKSLEFLEHSFRRLLKLSKLEVSKLDPRLNMVTSIKMGLMRDRAGSALRSVQRSTDLFTIITNCYNYSQVEIKPSSKPLLICAQACQARFEDLEASRTQICDSNWALGSRSQEQEKIIQFGSKKRRSGGDFTSFLKRGGAN